MSTRTHLRNFVVALIAVIAMLLGLAPRSTPPTNVSAAPPLQSGGFTISPATEERSASPGGAAVQFSTINITNLSGTDALDVTFTAVGSVWNIGIEILPSAGPIRINNGATTQIFLRVQVPGGRPINERNDITLRVFTNGGSNERARGVYTVVVIAPTSTPATPSITPTPVTPTATERPLCLGGYDPFENNDSLGSAKELPINTRQRQALCTVGDEDWIFFAGLKGKVYTIDIDEMDAGLDLSLELFDEDENQLAFNDDFYNRDPSAPNPNDLRPRIESWVAPENGLYYVRIRDAGGRGGTREGGEREYVVALRGESYGPTPTNIIEICEDLFEQDGLPEQSTLIVPNEYQPTHTLCPTGDADWVKFFAKAGKRYILFTDSRAYRPSANQNTDTEPGTDTTLLLVDRDGRTMIAYNDDIVGGNTLDSLIEFTVPADGVYFAQVKNVGDIGNQFIRYDLYLLLCLPEQTDCGRTRAAPTGVTLNATPTATSNTTPGGDATQTPTITPGGAATNTPNANEVQATFNAQDTADALTQTPRALQAQQDAQRAAIASERTATTKQTVVAAQARPAPVAAAPTPAPAPTMPADTFDQFSNFRTADGLINGPIQGFADQSFISVWQRTDRAVAEQREIRSWIWGPTWLMARGEPFAEAPGGMRQVQYFEKGRMEVNDPNGDRNNPWFVSSGLLAEEMIRGQVQVGSAAFVPHNVGTLPIAGDAGNFIAPTYTSFRRHLDRRSTDRNGELVTEALNRAGTTYPYRGVERPEARLVHYVEETGHNIPQVFWDYLNMQGLVWQNGRYEQQPLMVWESVTGFPLSEPYWVWTTVGGMDRYVLVQPFQRRVLIYTPDNSTGFDVEMGNVGHQYYEWRYQQRIPR